MSTGGYIDCTTMDFFVDKFPFKVILLSPSGKTLISDFTKFAFNLLDNLLANSSDGFPAIIDRLLI